MHKHVSTAQQWNPTSSLQNPACPASLNVLGDALIFGALQIARLKIPQNQLKMPFWVFWGEKIKNCQKNVKKFGLRCQTGNFDFGAVIGFPYRLAPLVQEGVDTLLAHHRQILANPPL